MSDSTKKIITIRQPAVSISGLLGVAFIVLKLCHVIAWPWLWVLAPFWLPLAIVLAIVGVLLGITLLAAIAAACLKHR